MSQPSLRRHVRIVRGEAEEALGCGFRLDSTRVLTCRHVVKGKTEVKVLDSTGEEWKPRDAKVLWPKSPEESAAARKLDAVILQTSEVAGFDPWTRFLRDGLSRSSPWKSHGFLPSALKPEHGHLLRGDVPAFERAHRTYYATLENAPVKPEYWKGISGSAILIDLRGYGGETFSGLLATALTKFGAKRIKAVAMPLLFKATGFLEALGLTTEDPRWARFVTLAEVLLQGDVAAKVAASNPQWLGVLPVGSDRHELAHRICLETAPEQVVESLADVYCSLVAQNDPDSDEVFRLMHCALPAAFLHYRGLPLPDRNATEVALEVSHELMVELALACIDGDFFELEIRPETPSDLLKAPFALPVPQEVGVDPRGEQGVTDLTKDLAMKAAGRLPSSPEADRLALKYVVEIGKRSVAPGGLSLLPSGHFRVPQDLNPEHRQSREETLGEIVDQRLGRLATKGRRFYIFAEPKDPREAAFYDRLGERLKNLRQTRRTGSAAQQVEEDRILMPLEEVYLAREKAKKETR